MFNTEYTDLKSSGVLNPLVSAYLSRNPALRDFYNYFPDQTGFQDLLNTNPYSSLDRNKLVKILDQQASLVANTSLLSKTNIQKLQSGKAYTVTTGHQLCLFTGPLYFIYKIFSTINLAEELKKLHPTSDFVPVYWMASEDHDFEEVNHFYLFGKKIVWESDQSGAVGNFKTDGLKTLFTSLRELLGTSVNANQLMALFEEAYLNHHTLAHATRYLVNALFGEYGLVIVDGNDVEFKKQFSDIIQEDIFENSSYKKVNESTEQLDQLKFTIQVNPRPINCFYIDGNQRNRIEKKDDKFQVLGNSISFNENEMKALITSHPEKISPNVVLRPLYQQRILPNLAYVGGPGELAYWLEFKAMFVHYNITLPILAPRNFVTLVEKNTVEKIKKLKFNLADFFRPEAELISQFMAQSAAVFELEQEQAKLATLYNGIQEKISGVDKSLSGSVSAELQKSINGLQNLVGKANKALKQKSETEINQIKTLRQKLFPEGLPQERHSNFSNFYLRYGPHFLKEIKKQLHPFERNQLLLLED